MKKLFIFSLIITATLLCAATFAKADDTATAQPDLSISASDLKITPASFKGGDKITLKATVANSGTTKASNVKVKFYFNGAEVFSKNITSISKKGKSAVSYQYILPLNLSGAVIFKVVADPENTVAESNEDNNEAEISVNIAAAQIDLTIDSVKTSVTKPKAGQKIFVQAKVKNIGNAKAANIRLNIYLGDNIGTPNFTINIPSINKNSVSAKSFSWTIPNNIPGANYPIKAVVDPENIITETNEINNEKTYLLNLTAPDLVLEQQDPGYKPRFTYMGLNTMMNLRIRNNNVVVIQNVKVGLFYYLPSNPDNLIKIGEENVGPIVKNWYKDFSLFGKIPTTIPVGSIVGLVAKADYANVIPETNEINNKLEYLISIREKPAQLSCPCLFINVSDEDGVPLSGATIKLNDSEIKITANGNVIFENRPDTASYALSITYPDYRSVNQTLNYNKNSEDAVYFNYQLDKKALVSGTVKNSAGAVLPWTNIRVEGTGLEAVTDAQGKYGFLLNGGAYTFRFAREGYNRAIESNYVIAPLSTKTLDKTMAPGTTAYFSGHVTDDEGNNLANTDIYVNGIMLGTTAADGHFNLNIIAGNNKKFTFKKPAYVNTEFTETIVVGNEYNYDLVMYKPSTDNHVERGANIVSWHQHEGTPANSFFIPEYNVDVWWGMGHVKMGMDFSKSGNQIKINRLVINARGDNWECNKVEGEGAIETSAIDIPITIAAGSCSDKKTQMDIYKVTIESSGQEVWSDSGFWSSASDPINSKSIVFTLNNLPVVWNSNLKVKMWVRVQKKAVIGTDGDGAGALYGYHMDKKLITWYPQKPPTTKVSTSWRQVSGYFLGILDNPVNAITGFMDIFTVDKFEQYTMEEVLSQNFPGSPPS
ncbi:carboxypeptidase regulatory-like domain-containing protein [Candidatus Falkowbacteria bacterium]|nr:carboxypeptidase regulatory-like domain-containing protein [Candidatus Falkowbacteria bacterium]